MKMNVLLTVCLFFGLAAAASAEDGVFHLKAGDVDFYSIQDKNGEMDNAVFGNSEAVARLAADGKSPSSFNVFVVKKGETVILIDTGVGGQMLERLKEAGIPPEKVNAVFLTHTHGDHVGGLLRGGTAVFPNASLWISASEWKFWKESNPSQAEKSAKAYGEPKIIPQEEKTPLVLPEVTAFNIAGHTPGHTGFLITSGDVKIAVVADLLHSSAIQFADPGINARYDRDGKAASEVRRKWMKRAAEEGLFFAASHVPFPGVGKVETVENGFRFTPVKHFYDFTVRDIDGNDISLSRFRGKKILVVNVASQCGLTPQYKELQELYARYGGEKFTILAFPSNNFGRQEPGTDAEIKEFCTKNYGVTFPVMSKISVKEDDMHPLYHWLTEKKLNGVKDAPVEWNFQKFLIDEKGNWMDVVPPKEKPDCEKILHWIN
ncbi:MAG: MBL fold metallo-hydrolase [Planctomycetaceae bacterium]|nr:MBL fold metallo-hydrolase [Planctomycetaceae bacterium]